MFPAIRRDCGLNAASREQFKRELSLMKIHYNYEKFARISDEVAIRRHIIKDLLLEENNHNLGITYDDIMSMDLLQL